MGIRNYLIEGLSGTGKTTVGQELQRRGYRVIHGDRALAYQGDPETGAPVDGVGHLNHIWDVDKVRALVFDRSDAMTFFCGGSRNFHRFIELFDEVFVLQTDLATLNRRLATRPENEFGGKPADRAFVARLHAAGDDVPQTGIRIDAAAPISDVVDTILSQCSKCR